MDKTVYIANGAGFSGDRFDAAVPLVAQLASCSGPRYLMFEVLAERTIAIAQIARKKIRPLAIHPIWKIICARYWPMSKNTK